MKKLSRFIIRIAILYISTLLIWRRFIKFNNNTINNNNYYTNESYNATNVIINEYKSLPITQSKLFYDNHNITYYLHILHESIKIIELPDSLSTLTVNKCNSLWRPKLPLIDHQHGLEVVVPNVLYDMLLSNKNNKCDINFLWKGNVANDNKPMLYYVQSYVYHVIYCTDKKNYKEDWTKRDPYWLELSNYITQTNEWKKNMGIDFLIPASHPESAPSRHHPTALGMLKKVTFLKSDFDVSGYEMKDIIVPYLSERIRIKDSKIMNMKRPILGFFAGGDNPKHGLRSMLAIAVKSTNRDDVIFTTDKIPDYMDKMISSKFCFIVRGDTSSSRRLFTAIATGCIPVIISDWIMLPFAELIDYSKFTINFPESIVTNVDSMINYLNDISTNNEYFQMVSFLKEVRPFLLYDYLNDDNMKSIINPVTLTFIEAIIKRKKYCKKIVTENISLLCKTLSTYS